MTLRSSENDQIFKGNPKVDNWASVIIDPLRNDIRCDNYMLRY